MKNYAIAASSARWVARIWGALDFIAVASFAIAATGGRIWEPLLAEPFLTSLFILILAAPLAGWRYELFGGLLSVGCYLAFKLYDGLDPLAFDAFTFLMLPGCFCLASWLLRLRKQALPPLSPENAPQSPTPN